MGNPLIDPGTKAHMRRVTVVCTWSYADAPGKKFIMVGFFDGRVVGGADGITMRLP